MRTDSGRKKYKGDILLGKKGGSFRLLKVTIRRRSKSSGFRMLQRGRGKPTERKKVVPRSKKKEEADKRTTIFKEKGGFRAHEGKRRGVQHVLRKPLREGSNQTSQTQKETESGQGRS